MRLIGSLNSEKQAFILYSVFLEEGIHSTYEVSQNPKTETQKVAIWIYEEDAIERALELYEEYKANPEDPKYSKIEFPAVLPQPPDLIARQSEKKESSEEESLDEELAKINLRKKRSYPLTYAVILICTMLFF